MVADWLKTVLLFAGCAACIAEQPASIVVSRQQRQPIPQQPLAEHGQGVALIFIGGFGDEISGIVPHMLAELPAPATPDTRAYYHWHAGYPADCARGAAALAGHIRAYRRTNPAADVVLIGHSMGASMALRVAAELEPQEGRVFLVTLDPADRSYTPRRPSSVAWWGNTYVVNSQSGHDYIAELGGRWNACAGADINLRFDGRQADEAGYLYIHDNAFSLMCSRGHGRHASLWDILREQLRTKEGTAPASDMPKPLPRTKPRGTK